jgi:hypothetical protein
MSAEGTSLADLEAGNGVQDAADAERMAAIMREVNASGGGDVGAAAEIAAAPSIPAPPMRPSAPAPPAYQQHYVEVPEREYKPRRRNAWATVTEKIRDPIIVSLLVFALSLPIVHTHVAKYASWAFAVGGQLSWLGLIALSLLAGVLFAGISGGAALLGY